MKNLILIFIISTFTFVSCNNKPTKTETETTVTNVVSPDPIQEFEKLHQFLKKFDVPAQTFTVSTNKKIKIRGNKGTVISMNPSDLETENGQPIGAQVTVELKELHNQQQLLLANTQTVSDGQLLVSGGAYEINVFSEGQKVKLKEGKSYSVIFPKLAKDEMALYYGQRDATNNVNWKQADQEFKSATPKKDIKYELIIVTQNNPKDTLRSPVSKISNEKFEKHKLEAKVYNSINLTQFGLINCDRLFNPNDLRTTIQFSILNGVEKDNFVAVYLVFTDINSVLRQSYISNENKVEGDTFNNVPVGIDVRFLAVAYQKEKIFATLTSIKKVKENHQEKLTLNEVTEKEFDQLMKKVK